MLAQSNRLIKSNKKLVKSTKMLDKNHKSLKNKSQKVTSIKVLVMIKAE